MKQKRSPTVFALAACAFAAVPDDSHATSLKSSGSWVARNETDGCHLSSTFGTGDRAITAEFIRYQPGDGFTLQLIGPLGAMRPTTITKLDFGLGKMERAHTLVGASRGRGALVMTQVRLDGWRRRTAFDVPPAITPADEARVKSLQFEVHNGFKYKLELGPMDKPMAAMRECTDRLISHWGYDPVKQARLKRSATPISEPATWLTLADFPPDALKEGQYGLVHFRLDISETGQVASCHVIARSEPDAFAETTCRLVLQRASFLPALDEHSTPIRSYYVQTVRWQARG